MTRVILLTAFYFILHIYCGNAAETLLSVFNGDPDEHRNVSELITSKGYPVEEHTVQTEDGYLLSVQRIPYGRNGNMEANDKEAVLFIHGILADAGCWVLDFPKQSLGFVLADEGYDTWLLNTRGCTNSRKHVIYTTNQNQFWNFSFDEVAQFDVPNTIDYILEATGKEKLYIIGHSQGTTATFAMLSEMSDYNDKVKLFIALAPVGTVGHIPYPVRALEPFKYEIYITFEVLTAGEFLPNDKISRFLKTRICDTVPEICEEVIFAVSGVDRAQLNETRLGVYASQFPAGTSIKSLVHYSQMIKSNRFCKYDYFTLGNLKQYNQEEPPDYNPSFITTPVALFWSENDKLADPEDVKFLRRTLNSIVLDYEVPYPYNHIDFLVAFNAVKLIHEPILQLLQQY